MGNLLNNRINTIATPTQITGVKNNLQGVLTNLPFLVGLTVDERKSLPSVDVSNKVFTEDAINAAVNNPALVPSYISVANIQNDIVLFNQLDEISAIISQVQERIEDTKMLVGSEAYQAALNMYKAFGNAADAGAPGADAIVAKLGQRFASNGNSVKEMPKAQTPPSSDN